MITSTCEKTPNKLPIEFPNSKLFKHPLFPNKTELPCFFWRSLSGCLQPTSSEVPSLVGRPSTCNKNERETPQFVYVYLYLFIKQIQIKYICLFINTVHIYIYMCKYLFYISILIKTYLTTYYLFMYLLILMFIFIFILIYWVVPLPPVCI